MCRKDWQGSQHSSAISMTKAGEKPSPLGSLSQLSCKFLIQKPIKMKPVSLSLEILRLLWFLLASGASLLLSEKQFCPPLHQPALNNVVFFTHNSLHAYQKGQIILISHKHLGKRYLILFPFSLQIDHQQSWGESLNGRLLFLHHLSLCYRLPIRNKIKHHQGNRSFAERHSDPTSSFPKQNTEVSPAQDPASAPHTPTFNVILASTTSISMGITSGMISSSRKGPRLVRKDMKNSAA